jgi:hypothetical protein
MCRVGVGGLNLWRHVTIIYHDFCWIWTICNSRFYFYFWLFVRFWNVVFGHSWTNTISISATSYYYKLFQWNVVPLSITSYTDIKDRNCMISFQVIRTGKPTLNASEKCLPSAQPTHQNMERQTQNNAIIRYNLFWLNYIIHSGHAAGGAVGWGTALQGRR